MKMRSLVVPTIFLQAVIVLIGIGTLALMLWEPHLEGRNAHATLFEIYFKDPFLAYAYAASLSFFAGLYQTFKVLGYVRQNKAFSTGALHALRVVKYCALALVALIMAPMAYLFIARPGDDIAGGVAIGLGMIFIFAITAAAASMFERIVQNAVDIKPPNDVTA